MPIPRSIHSAAKIVFLALLVAFLILLTVSFPIGVYVALAFFKSEEPQILENLPFFFFGLAASIKVRVDALTLVFLLLAVYLYFVYLAAKEPFEGVVQTFRSVYSKGVTSVQNNVLATVCTVFAPLLFASVLLEYLQGLLGVSTGSLPKGDPLIDFALLTYAPLSEEFGFRLTLIGVVASLPPLYYGEFNGALHSLWRPSSYFDGSEKRKARSFLNSLVVFSAFMFGTAHVIYGAGWDVGKIAPSFAAGLCLGWLYVKWGFHAAVLLHLLFNFFSASFDYFAEIVGSPFILDVVSFLTYSFGAVVLTWIALRIFFPSRIR